MDTTISNAKFCPSLKNWFELQPFRYCKSTSESALQEANDIVSQPMDDIMHDIKNKVEKWKLNFESEPGTYCEQIISESDSEHEPYIINSLNHTEAGKDNSNDRKERRCFKIRGIHIGPSENYNEKRK